MESILEKMRQYCAYQERSHREVRTRLIQLKVYGHALEEIMVQLIEEQFLNEQRYASSYARGKMEHLQWGRIKIRYGLRQQQVSETCIRQALEELDPQRYTDILDKVAAKKWNSLSGTNPMQRQWKVKQYLVGKGFEPDEIESSLRSLS